MTSLQKKHLLHILSLHTSTSTKSTSSLTGDIKNGKIGTFSYNEVRYIFKCHDGWYEERVKYHSNIHNNPRIMSTDEVILNSQHEEFILKSSNVYMVDRLPGSELRHGASFDICDASSDIGSVLHHTSNEGETETDSNISSCMRNDLIELEDYENFWNIDGCCSAIRIQQVFRKFIIQRRYRKLKNVVICIQIAFRNRNHTLVTGIMDKEINKNHCSNEEKVLIIQACIRRYLFSRKYSRYRHSVLVIQSHFRGTRCRKYLLQKRYSMDLQKCTSKYTPVTEEHNAITSVTKSPSNNIKRPTSSFSFLDHLFRCVFDSGEESFSQNQDSCIEKSRSFPSE
jgi:hypothetical protein